MLEHAGVKITRQTENTDCAGIPFAFGPKVLIEPSFALTLQDLRDTFQGKNEISAGSTVVLGGKAGEKPIKDMKIDGTLRAQTPVNFFKHFDERFVTFVPSKASDNEALRIRGYKPNEVDA